MRAASRTYQTGKEVRCRIFGIIHGYQGHVGFVPHIVKERRVTFNQFFIGVQRNIDFANSWVVTTVKHALDRGTLGNELAGKGTQTKAVFFLALDGRRANPKAAVSDGWGPVLTKAPGTVVVGRRLFRFLVTGHSHEQHGQPPNSPLVWAKHGGGGGGGGGGV